MPPNPTQKTIPQQQSTSAKYYSSTRRTPNRTTQKSFVHSTREHLLTEKTFPSHRNTKYYSSTRRAPINTTPKPWSHSTRPRPVQIDHGFKCQNSKRSNNSQKMKRDFDYFALSMNWPETACRFLMTKGKTCSIPGIVLKNWQECCWCSLKHHQQHCDRRHQLELLELKVKNIQKQMLISGLFMGFGQITKTSDTVKTFQSIVVVKTPISDHLTDNLSHGLY